MSLHISKSAFKGTECNKNFGCLIGSAGAACCKIDMQVGDSLFMVKCSELFSCPHHSSCGASHLCNCPVRKALNNRLHQTPLKKGWQEFSP